MSRSADETHTLHDPLEVLKEVLEDGWMAGRERRPSIDLRSRQGDLRVQFGDFVSLYQRAGFTRERVGTRHRNETFPAAIDIRSASRASALRIRDEVVRIIEAAAIKPDRHGEWSELILGSEAQASDYQDYSQIVIDVDLKKWLRARPGRTAMGEAAAAEEAA